MRTPAVRKVLVSYAFMALVTVSVHAVFVLWLYTPISAGGVGFSVSGLWIWIWVEVESELTLL